MRWENLFADLEAQLAAAEVAETEGELADRTRGEAALLRLVDRLLGATGSTVAVQVEGAGWVRGGVLEVGQEWLLIDEGAGREVLVPHSAVLSVVGLGAATAAPGSAGRVFERLRLSSALRGISRDRSEVAVVLRDGSSVVGVIDRVGGDFLELRSGHAGEPRSSSVGASAVTVPSAAVVLLRRNL